MGAFGDWSPGPWSARWGEHHSVWRLAQVRALAAERGMPGYQVVQRRHTHPRPRPGAGLGVQRHVDDEPLAVAELDVSAISAPGWTALVRNR